MATRVTTYNPSDIHVVFGGHLISGYSPGRMMEYVPDAPVWEDGKGVDNERARWQTNDPYSTLSVYLQPSSKSNATLNDILNLDRLTGTQFLPVSFQDVNGPGTPSSIIAITGWLNKQPDIVYSDGVESRKWDIRMVLSIHEINGWDETPPITL